MTLKHPSMTGRCNVMQVSVLHLMLACLTSSAIIDDCSRHAAQFLTPVAIASQISYAQQAEYMESTKDLRYAPAQSSSTDTDRYVGPATSQ